MFSQSVVTIDMMFIQLVTTSTATKSIAILLSYYIT